MVRLAQLVQTKRDPMIIHAAAHAFDQPMAPQSKPAQDHTADTPDGALMAAIVRGDQHAMRRLYERHSVRVYRFARRLGVDHSTAEDVVSEVFLEVWRC